MGRKKKHYYLYVKCDILEIVPNFPPYYHDYSHYATTLFK